MSTTLVTREQFEYSILKEFADYSSEICDKLILTEINEQELRKFKLACFSMLAIRKYFSRYNGETIPTDDDNYLTKEEIEAIVELFNFCVECNYWYDFHEDPE